MDLTQIVANGLFPFEDNSRNAPYAEDYQNHHPTPNGSIPALQVTWPIANVAETVSHPHGQILRAGEVILYFTATTVSTVNASNWNATALTTYDADIPANTRAISSGSQWHVVGAREMWIATNGVCFVYSLPSNAGGKVLVADNSSAVGFTLASICLSDGGLVLGGLTGDAIAETIFASLIELWKARAPMDVVRNEDMAFATNWIVAGPPGGGENDTTYLNMLALLSLFPAGMDDTYFNSTLRTWVEQGLLVFHPLKHKGAVLKVLPWGQRGLMVYTADTVYRLERRQDGAFTEEVVSDYGVPGRGAACGDETAQRWITKQALAFKNELNVGVTPLYGRPFLSNLTMDNNLIAVYDEYRGYTWFSSTNIGYCVTDLGKWSRMDAVKPISLLRHDGTALLGTATKSDADDEFILITCPFDGGEQMKRQSWGIAAVNCGSKDNATDVLENALIAKMELGAAFTTFDLREIDRRGRSPQWNIGGVEFKVKIRCAEYENCDLSHLSVDVTNGPFSMRPWMP